MQPVDGLDVDSPRPRGTRAEITLRSSRARVDIGFLLDLLGEVEKQHIVEIA